MDALLARFRSLGPANYTPVSTRHAAVLVPLFQDAGGIVRVLLTKRSATLPTHRGEVCLPGGKRDPGDADDVHTALREAWEELGLQRADVEVLAVMPPFLSKHMLSVTPVVAQIPAGFQPQPNPAEVESVFDMPLHRFLEPEGHTFRDMAWEGLAYRTHYFDYQGMQVWGLTAAIMIHVAKAGTGRAPAFDELAPGGLSHHRLVFDGVKVGAQGGGLPLGPGAAMGLAAAAAVAAAAADAATTCGLAAV